MKISTLSRWFCLTILIFCVSLLGACGGGGNGETPPPSPPPANNETDDEPDEQPPHEEEADPEEVDPARQVITVLDMNPADLTQTLADPDSRRLFVLSGSQRWLKVIDMMTGDDIAQLSFEHTPERMAISPNGEHFYVAQITDDHSSYRWEEDQQGHITPIDLSTLEAGDSREVDLDPFDMVALDDGSYVVTSGSGQWTRIKHYNRDGSTRTEGRVYQRSTVTLHPSQQAVYVATNGLSPSKFYRTNLGGNQLSEDRSSPHGGPSRVFGRAWPSTNGNLALTRGGDIFNDSNLQVNRSLTASNQTIEQAFNDYVQRVTIAVTSDNKVIALNGTTLDPIKTLELAGTIENAYLAGPYAFYLTNIGDELTLIREGHPCPDCRNNTAPNASFSASPDSPDTGTTLLLDATASTDTETPDDLQYRWDLSGNGEWDTEFSDEALFEHRYDVPGEYLIRLQVRDPQGLRNTHTRIVTVTQGIDTGTAVTNAEVSLPTSVNFSLDHPERDLLFRVSEETKRLYLLNAENGAVVHYFSFSRYPGRMALSPEGDELYLALNPVPHASFQYDNHPGHVAVIDLNDRAYTRTIATEVSPYDLVVTRNNKLIVSSSLTSNTQLITYNASSGARLGAVNIQGRSRLAVSPTQDRLYALPRGGSNRIVVFNTGGTSLTQISSTVISGLSMPLGDHFWITADGQHLITQGGYLLDSNNLNTVAYVGENWQYLDAAFSDAEQGIFTVVHNNNAVTYNALTFEEITRTHFTGLSGGYYKDGAIYYLINSNDGPSLVQGSHPCPACADNTAPHASFSYAPAPGTIADTLVFDASASHDAEDEDALRFRWAINGQWVTEYSASSLFNHRFTVPGDYQVRLRVRDSGGLIDTDEQTLAIEAGAADAITVDNPVEGVLDFLVQKFTHNLDTGKLYAVDNNRRRVYTVDLPSRTASHYYEFTVAPAELSLSPDGETLFVLLEEPAQASHERRHYIAVVDLLNEAHINTFALDYEAFDIEATLDGRLAITPTNSWQSHIVILDPSTGAQVKTAAERGRGRITRHPSENWLYISYSSSHPGAIERYSLNGSELTQLNSSPSGVSIGHMIWMSGGEGENAIITRSGTLFDDTQLTVTGQLDGFDTWNNLSHLVHDTEQGLVFAVISHSKVAVYNHQSLEVIQSEDYPAYIIGALPYQEQVYYLIENVSDTDIIIQAHPCPDCGSNTPPTAELTVSAGDNSTADNILFDASSSSDPEDGSDLSYRWDIGNNGEWLAPYSSEPTLTRRFLVPGTHEVRLRVRDSAGAIDELVYSLDITEGDYTGTPVEGSTSNQLDFRVDDALLIQERNELFIISRQDRRVYRVDLASGLTEHYYEFPYSPQRLAVSPDAETLYIALTTASIDDYGYTEHEEYGYIAALDLGTGLQTKALRMDINPFDVAATEHGTVIVTSANRGSNGLAVYDFTTGAQLSTFQASQHARITLLPGKNQGYVSSEHNSIHRLITLAAGNITSQVLVNVDWDARYTTRIWASPDGEYLITDRGDLLYSDLTLATALFWRDLRQLTFSPDGQHMLTLDQLSQIRRTSTGNWNETGQLEPMVDAKFLIDNGTPMVIRGNGTQYRLEVLPFSE